GAEHLAPEAADIIVGAQDREHLHRAARKAKAQGPERVRAPPLEELVHVRDEDVGVLLGGNRVDVPDLRDQLCHSRAPFFHAYAQPTSTRPTKIAISTSAALPSFAKRSAHGIRKIASMSM